MINPKVKDFLDEISVIMDSIERNRKLMLRTFAGTAYTIEQLGVVSCIQQIHNCTSTQLAEILNVKKSSITSIINNLVEKNIVARTGDPHDRRNIILTLTEEGEHLYHQKIKEYFDLVSPSVLTLEDEEMEDIRKGLVRLEALLRNVNKK